MAFCRSCGSKLDDNATFCPNCGAPVENANTANNGADGAKSNVGNDISDALNKLNDTADTTTEYDKQDIDNNLLMGILCYISILVFIPIFAAKDSRYVRFHANQGLVLFIAEIVWYIASSILKFIIRLSFFAKLLSFLNIVFVILAVLGIVNVVNGKAKELPVIGSIRILK